MVIEIDPDQLRDGDVAAAQVMSEHPLVLKVANSQTIKEAQWSTTYSMQILNEALGRQAQHSGALYILRWLASLTDETRPSTEIEI